MKKSKILLKYTKVEVEWEDSTQPNPSWCFTKNIQLLGPVECISIGFLLEQDKSTICLAPNIGEIGTESEQASGVMYIPKSSIKSIKIL